jgi:hypothetical protein
MLFNTMPRNTNPKGIAIINRGFMSFSFFRPLDSLWILEEGGVRTGNTFAVEPEPKSIPLLDVARSVFYLLRAITALENEKFICL